METPKWSLLLKTPKTHVFGWRRHYGRRSLVLAGFMDALIQHVNPFQPSSKGGWSSYFFICYIYTLSQTPYLHSLPKYTKEPLMTFPFFFDIWTPVFTPGLEPSNCQTWLFGFVPKFSKLVIRRDTSFLDPPKHHILFVKLLTLYSHDPVQISNIKIYPH